MRQNEESPRVVEVPMELANAIPSMMPIDLLTIP